MSSNNIDSPYWERPQQEDEKLARQQEHQSEEHLSLDPRPPAEINAMVLEPMYHAGTGLKVLFPIVTGFVILMMVTWTYQMIWGLGVTGLTRPVMWAIYIVNFVYFIGVGHAGTFISAALRVLKIEFRRPISRAAETITVFALMTAALFPIIHLGRSWKFYWLLPYPNERQIWPSYHSPLMWDLTAILTYLTCSMLFAYIGLLPDFAMGRNHGRGWRQKLYRALAMGWRGTEKEWKNQETALNIFSYAIIPVMFSVHTIVSWDFAMTLQPGWHSTIFGPYFVVGALFSGVAAVIIALILLRKALHLEYFLRPEHFNGMASFLLLLSLTWDYFYFNDYIAPWFGGAPADKTIFALLSSGSAAPFWYFMLFCNVIVPPFTLFSRKIRTSLPALFAVALLVNIGMYLERVVIVPITLGQNEIPFSWGVYHLQIPETLITIGAFALVFFLYIIFTRIFPVIPTWEIYEGQVMQGLRKIGRALIPTKSESD